MAWVNEYDLQWLNKNNTVNGHIYLDRDEGSYQMPLLLSRESLEIRQDITNWESHVVKTNCTFSFENDQSDFYALMPLMTISAGQIRVRVTHGAASGAETEIFIGYLNCETVSQKMIHYSSIRLTASWLLGKLKYLETPSLETLQNMSLIDLLDDCLVLTGSAYNIRVHCTLYEVNNALSSGQTLFNRTALYTELYWKNNVDRVDALKILESMMKSFDSYIYWFDGYWYIEHYQDMGAALNSPYQKTYVEYTTSTSYDGAGSGTNQVVTIGAPPDIHDPLNRPQVGNSQTLAVNPGLRQISIRKQHKLFFNFIYPDLSDITLTPSNELLPDPKRTWLAYDPVGSPDWSYQGLPAFAIENAIYRSGWDITGGSGQLNGLTTRFIITTQPDTELTIKFKWIWVGSYPAFRENPSDYDIHFYWYLRTVDGTYFTTDTDGDWISVPGGSYVNDYNIHTISGTDVDPDLLFYEGSLTVSIGTALSHSTSLDTDLVFRMGTELIEPLTAGSSIPAIYCYYGDFSATISETPDNNLLEGTQVTDFLDKKTITLDLFDSTWSYKNSLLRWVDVDGFEVLTESWTYGGATAEMELARWLLTTRFRLYNVARQKITVTYVSSEIFRPLQIWTDSKQTGVYFILAKDTYKPESDEHLVQLWQYDDTTVINLI